MRMKTLLTIRVNVTFLTVLSHRKAQRDSREIYTSDAGFRKQIAQHSFANVCSLLERKRRAPTGGSKSIKLGSSIIRESRVVSFLGLEISRDLNWGPQVRKIVSKCQNPLKILSCLRHTWWGADPALLIRLYIAIVRSRIEYASFLFCDLSRTQSLTLDRIQFKALRLAMGYRTSTPTNVILAESGQPPLSLRFRYLGRNYVTRVLSDSTHRVTPALQEILDFIENPVNVGEGP